MDSRNPIRAAAEARLGPVKVARDGGALYYAPAGAERVALTAEDVGPFETWTAVEPRELGADLARLRGREIVPDELALLMRGIKLLEMSGAQSAWQAYERALRRRAARCLRERHGGGALYACWSAMALSKERGADNP